MPLGETAGMVSWSGAQWEVTVLEAYPDLRAALQRENPFNDSPEIGTLYLHPLEPGTQFYMAVMRIKQVGPDSATFVAEATISSVGSSGVAYSGYDLGCGLIPNDFTTVSLTELFTGGQLEGNLCWQISADDAESLMMFIDFGFSSENRVWFALR